MKKIVAYIGSNNPHSITVEYTERICARIEKDLNEEIQLKLFTARKSSINECLGCLNCFKRGCCVWKDDTQNIVTEMKNSDLIIFGSPVYSHSISGSTKKLIDRITWLTHTLAFSGKRSLVLSTCTSNGHETVINQLEKYLTDLGSLVIAKTNCATEYPNEFNDSAVLENKCKEISKVVIDSWNEEVTTSDILELKFRIYKKMMKYRFEHGDISYESLFWEKSGMLSSGSLLEYINKKE